MRQKENISKVVFIANILIYICTSEYTLFLETCICTCIFVVLPEKSYSSGHLVLSLLGLAFVLLVETSDILYRLDIIPVCDIITGLNIFTEFDISPNIGFHRAFATGVACQQGTLTPPDTWSCPTLGLACVLMSRPISPELVLSPDF